MQKSPNYSTLKSPTQAHALGRGPEYYDVEALDRVVSSMEKQDGRFSALVMGVIESAPFQKVRRATPDKPAAPAQAGATQASASQAPASQAPASSTPQ